MQWPPRSKVSGLWDAQRSRASQTPPSPSYDGVRVVFVVMSRASSRPHHECLCSSFQVALWCPNLDRTWLYLIDETNAVEHGPCCLSCLHVFPRPAPCCPFQSLSRSCSAPMTLQLPLCSCTGSLIFCVPCRSTLFIVPALCFPRLPPLAPSSL